MVLGGLYFLVIFPLCFAIVYVAVGLDFAFC